VKRRRRRRFMTGPRLFLLCLIGAGAYGYHAGYLAPRVHAVVSWSQSAWNTINAPTSNYNIDLCSTSSYNVQGVSCNADDNVVSKPADERLVVSGKYSNNTFTSSAVYLRVYEQDSQNHWHKKCTGELLGSIGYNKQAWHLDEALSLCDYALVPYRSYRIGLNEDNALDFGHIDFEYEPA